MEKIWYIQINGLREGPFCLDDLKRDTRLTPDVLVWKKGFADWIPIRNVQDLKDVFKDANPPKEDDSNENHIKVAPPKIQNEELILDMQQSPPQFSIWIFILLIGLACLIFQWYWHT